MDTVQPAFTKLTDLAAERLGGKTLFCSDDFFAEKENLLKPGRGIFIADKYTDRGKWMDGWESRRKRIAGYDWCIIQLATSGKIKGVDIDTNHFLGNHPPYASMDACYVEPDTGIDEEKLKWIEILPKSPLKAGSHGGGGDHLLDAAGPGVRAEGARADLGGDQVAARLVAQDSAAHHR